MSSFRTSVLAVLFCLGIGCDAFMEFRQASNSTPTKGVKTGHEFAKVRTKQILADMTLRRDANVQDYICDGCLSDDGTGKPVVLKIMFVEEAQVVVNQKAMEAAEAAGTNYECGSCCFDRERAHPECFVAENWNGGWVSKPVMRILVKTGARLLGMTEANLTAEASALSVSQHVYSLCPVEVMLGHVDLCVGDWWETLLRRTQSQFSTPLHMKHFKLLTVAKEKEDFQAKTLLEMFQPFSGAVWASMLGVFVLAGLFFWVLDEKCEDFNSTEEFPHPKGCAKALWVASMGYFAGNQFEVTSWPARIVLLGYSFFLATSIAAYTANLASFMVQQREDFGLVTSLTDIVMRGKSLCLSPQVANLLTEPGIMERAVLMSAGSMASMFEMLYMGQCDASLAGDDDYLLYAQANNVQFDICTTERDPNHGGGFFCVNEGSNLTRFDLTKCQCGTEPPLEVPAEECPRECVAPHTRYCNIIEVLDPTLRVSLNYGLPTSDFLEPYISAGIVASKIAGDFAQDYKQELLDVNPLMCPKGSAQERFKKELAKSTGAQSLSVEQMAGTFLFAFILMALGLLCRAVELWRGRDGGSEAEDEESRRYLREESRKRSDWETSSALKFRAASADCIEVPPNLCDSSDAATSQAITPSASPPLDAPRTVVVTSGAAGNQTVEERLFRREHGDGMLTAREFDGMLTAREPQPMPREAEEQLFWVGTPAAAAAQAEVEAKAEVEVQASEVGAEEALRLAETKRVMAEREAEFRQIKLALARVAHEVKSLQEAGPAPAAGGAQRFTSGGLGSSFRKRQGR